MTSRSELSLEGRPTDEQKDRLENFLSELMLITRKYGMLLVDDHETLQLHDLRNGNHLVGVGLVGFTSAQDPNHVLMYVPADSILDGTWLIDTDKGPVEQHAVTNVFPRRCS